MIQLDPTFRAACVSVAIVASLSLQCHLAVGAETTDSETAAEEHVPLVDLEGLIRLVPKQDVWTDQAHKRVVMVGEVCLRQGVLEMFACLKNTKEHESILAVDAAAQVIHAGLLAVGAKVGRPVQFVPEFKPATGSEIEITLIWTDAEGNRQQARAQDWIRDIHTRKSLAHPWVFAGSGFWVNERTGERHYMAEDGDVVCVSNFTSAMLDLPVASTQAAGELLFEAYTERIPPRGTPVTVLLKPKPPAAGKDKPAPDTKSPASDRGKVGSAGTEEQGRS